MQHPSTPGADLAATVAALVADLAELRRDVAALRARRGPRDAEDRALLEVLAESTEGRPFVARELFAHAERVDARLAAALAAATLSTPGELGCWLRRLAGRHGRICVTRHRRDWRVHFDTSKCGPDCL